MPVHAYIPMKDTSFKFNAVKSEINIIMQITYLLNMVYTSIYLYILVYTITTHVFNQIRLVPPCYAVSSPLPSSRLLVPFIGYSSPPRHSLFDRQTTKLRLTTTKLPQPLVYRVHIAA